ncbi:hypothetical protein ACCO45_009722 [Purpureocillium lilacinum]|uniref:Uncharacterized protein n=1 Tax=Purpureocillium lilacinum TaxID=33203 RepID=A0ACC4DN59_PURLI
MSHAMAGRRQIMTRWANAALNVRQFSTSGPRQSAGLKINADRLNKTLHDTCQWGAAHRYGSGPTETGMARLALTDDDAHVRRWFADEVKSLGCSLTVDQMGNMFAKRPGAGKAKAPMIAMGSHLDTQPRGGRYDGILGVMAGLEALRTLQENGYKTNFDIGLVNWTNTDASQRGGSPVSQVHGLVRRLGRRDPDGQGLESGRRFRPGDNDEVGAPEARLPGRRGLLERRGSRCPSVRSLRAAHRTGPDPRARGQEDWRRLWSSGVQVVHLHSRRPRRPHWHDTLEARSDPLLAAAKMIASSHAIAKKYGALASTGIVKIPTNSSTNTIASETSFTLDIRHPEDGVVAEVEKLCLDSFRQISKEDGKGVALSWTLDTDSPAVKFDRDCIQAVEAAATELVGPDGWLPITSGAGHDSVYTSSRCPTTMIFVPCRDGVSHHPEEYCSPEDCAIGTQALLDAVLYYDERKGSTIS